MIKPPLDEVSIHGNSWSHPVHLRFLGWVLLVVASLLILGGAYRMQSNMITSGLLFLSLGVIFARPNLMNKLNLLGLASLMVVGAVYTFLT